MYYGIIVNLYEMYERKLAMEQSKLGKNLINFGHIQDTCPFGMIIFGQSGKFIYANDMAYSLLNIKNEKGYILPEENFESLIDELNSQDTFCHMNRYIRSYEQRIENCKEVYKLYYLVDVTNDVNEENIKYIFEQAMNSMPTYAGIIIDKNGIVLMYNELSSKYDGIPREYVIGKHVRCITTDLENDELMRALKTGKPKIDHKLTYTTYNGNKINAIGSCFPIYKNNVIVGAYGYYRHESKFNSVVSEIIELQNISKAKSKSNSNGTRYTFNSVIGESAVIIDAKKKCKKSAMLDTPILIYGETGTGKELFAQSIHNSSKHVNGPFVAINCSAIPENLLESTLFGTTKGAYTGSKEQLGLFEYAKNGTIFLDEINSMPLHLQPKLLRVIQEHMVRKLGSTEEIPIKCRIITSCNQSPQYCLEKNIIRTDLYYRISTITIDIPPLRSRGNDIIFLADYFINYFSIYSNLPKLALSDEVKSIFLNYSWPGNVRELQHNIESILALSDNEKEMTLNSIPEYMKQSYPSSLGAESISIIPNENLKNQLMQLEKSAIERALKENSYNLSKTSRQIGYTRSNLQYRINILNIDLDK